MVVFLALLSLAAIPPAVAATAPAKAKTAPRVKVDPNRPPADARPIYESIVVDAATGLVLHQVNADTPAYPASLTKMMTMYLLFEALEQGKVRLDTPMKVSKNAAAQDPSKLNLVPGTTITVEPAIYAIVTRSANDVAMVIAEHLGGTEARFGQQMTARARAIGMTRTQFKNPHGLPNKGQISSARDMAILARRLMIDFPDKYAYFSKTEFPFRGVMLQGHNHFMENYAGADGLKTGYTFASGYNLAATARRGDQRLITVVFGGPTAKVRDDHVAELMDAGFRVLEHQPETLMAAQTVDPFPAQPTAPATTETVGGETAVADAAAASTAAGDVEDTATAPAAPLAATVALVPALSSGNLTAKGKTAARQSATLRAAPATSAPTSGNWGIQVGAFADRELALKQANAAAHSVSAAFSAITPRVVPIVVKGRTLHRAQVIGLDQKNTTRACQLAIKSSLAKVECKPVKPDQTVAMQ